MNKAITTLILIGTCIALFGCEKQTDLIQSTDQTQAEPTPRDIEKVIAKFKSSPGFRTEEAKVLVPLVKQGMSEEEVKAILGEPDLQKTTNSDTWRYSVFYSQMISVSFKDGEVVKIDAVGIN